MVIIGRFYLGLAAFILWASLTSAFASEAKLPGEEAVWNRLMQDYREAHDTENLEAMMALSFWEGVSEDYRQQVERTTRGSFLLRIVQISVEPWQESNNHLLRRRFSGEMLTANLEPVAQLRVIFESPRAGARGGVIYTSLFPVGMVEDSPRLIQLRPAPQR